MATSRIRKRRTRADGERSYQLIVDTAARLATIEGLEGLSIGRLAGEIGMSKGGLYAHFDSK
jgi:AcrR family transcriptional regulator